MHMLHSLLLASLAYITAVSGVPTWERFSSRSSISSLVPIASAIEAKGLPYNEPYYLAANAPTGVPGNASVTRVPQPADAPLFFINHNRLYQYTNDSYIFTVNVLNTTAVPGEPMPYKLVLSDKPEGLENPVWRWRGTSLHFDYGQKTNLGLLFACFNKDGKEGVYLWFDPAPTPEACTIFTPHSFNALESQGLQTPLT
ncbi:hypothetical protein FA95DRAFT_1552139 [Auriscalpium vulgare]|uniref:Uncharacterized protein n=1 Tax=Auriscalpium vulgare TaxID=40419 RepID=A0ACB8SBV0_9AGAM|nr:hypothetical protein FA95DRAFT_1552139 [Auriscalpium vulgare]